MPCTEYLKGRGRPGYATSKSSRGVRRAGARAGDEKARAELAAGVPAFWKRDQRPGLLVVVGGQRRRLDLRQIGQEILLRRGFDRHSDGLQQSVEFYFAHRALPGFSQCAQSQKSAVSRLIKQFKLYRSGGRGRPGYE